MGMHSYCHNFTYLSLVALILSVSGGCSSNIEAPKAAGLSALKVPAEVKDTADVKVNAIPPANNNECQIDLEQEAAIEKKCLQAWRKCIAGQKNEGIADLKKLHQKYPKSSSVLFMTGQVLDKFGNKKEAIAYYEKAANNSDFAVISLFKIAESMRTTGNTEQAIIRYRKLVNIAPQFSLAHLGLAKALIKLDPASKEGKEELKTVLELDPNNKEAKTLSAQSGRGNL